ncbi:MAG: SPOR domain-containing protein [Phaeodactylibacter xiamenensis]|nr:SPOR domain-containing protein [Phaeodactylibacter xiamenensis]MCR9054943.1 SPOR domain-containing protein [bacterium]
MSYSILIRVVLPLLIGYWIARRTRHLIMSLVLRLMPLKVRLSQKAFAMQTRITMIVGVGIIAATLLAFNYAYVRVVPMTAEAPGKAAQELAPLPAPAQTPPTPKQPVIEPAPEAPAAAPELREPEKAAVAVPKPQPYFNPQPPPVPIETPVYLQLSAFRNYESAWAMQHRVAPHYRRPVWVGHHTYDAVPYKVLIGPFRSRRAAIEFKKAQRLKAFPRTLDEIRLYQS